MQRLTDILKHLAGPTQALPESSHVTYRHARPADADALATLAQLDSSRPLRGDVLVAESHGELWAAISLADSRVIANPFRPSGELAFSLVDRARRLRRDERRRHRQSGARPKPISVPYALR